jgi:hypothetical protein
MVWDIKAHKGGKASVIVGNVRDVEIMINLTTILLCDLVRGVKTLWSQLP